jgi:hypothetical protein
LANVYSTLLASVASVGTSVTVLYTCPAGFRAVVRDITIFSNTTANAPNDFFAFQDLANHTAFWTVSSTYFQTGVQYHWDGHQVFNVGDGVRVNLQGTAFAIRMSGYQLTLP